jgi:predicted metal-dependent HD superfamily phosphohydrolase
LLDRFLNLAPNKNKIQVREAYDNLVAKYREVNRHYHTMEHLRLGLQAYDELFHERQLTRPEFFAWMYHDVIYNSQASDNEERSAVYFMRDRELLGWEIDHPELDLITKVIEATNPSRDAISVVNDIDLSVLGMDEAVYAWYQAGVRKEYAWVDDASWRAGRAAVLKNFLERDRLYLTNEFAARYTSQAYANIRSEFQALLKR